MTLDFTCVIVDLQVKTTQVLNLIIPYSEVITMTVDEAVAVITSGVELTPEMKKALDFLEKSARKQFSATSKQVWLINKKLEESGSTLADFVLDNNIQVKDAKQLTKEEASDIIKLLTAEEPLLR